MPELPQTSLPSGGPFAETRPALIAALGFAVAALVWATWGDGLPGGRWLAVHLFTLGVLTTLIVAMTHHFGQTLMHARDRPRGIRLAIVDGGAVLVLVGLPTGRPLLVAIGATVLTGGVMWLYLDLRGMRRGSLTGRFSFVVRAYERACGAFIHGAILGGLMGAGVLSGPWYVSARVAHLHINVLGWAGLTVLATVVFFAPTLMRTRMEEGADVVAARWLGRSASGLTVATFALLLTGLGGSWAIAFRVVAALGLAVYAAGTVAVCLPVIRVGRQATAAHQARILQAASAWFAVVAIADVLLVASGQLRLLDALGLAMLVGVLGQVVLAALTHLVPMAFARGAGERARAAARLARWPLVRLLALNGGIALVAVASALGTGGGEAWSLVARGGWLLVLAAVVWHLGLLGATVVSGLLDGRAAERAT